MSNYVTAFFAASRGHVTGFHLRAMVAQLLSYDHKENVLSSIFSLLPLARIPL